MDQAIDIVKSSDIKNDFIFAGSDDFSFTSDNLTKKGFVNDLSELFKISKVLLCPSAYDSYPGVTIECIKYGVIPIVSDQCGSSHDLIKIDTNLVAKYSHTDEWVNKINIVLNYSDDDYRKLVFNLSKLYNKFYKHE